MKRESQEQFSFPLVADTVSRFPEEYKIQAAGREINPLFVRPIAGKDHFHRSWVPVANTEINFTREEILQGITGASGEV